MAERGGCHVKGSLYYIIPSKRQIGVFVNVLCGTQFEDGRLDGPAIQHCEGTRFEDRRPCYSTL